VSLMEDRYAQPTVEAKPKLGNTAVYQPQQQHPQLKMSAPTGRQPNSPICNQHSQHPHPQVSSDSSNTSGKATTNLGLWVSLPLTRKHDHQ
jgi:hypothetical protein